jgi:hypothetical protein
MPALERLALPALLTALAAACGSGAGSTGTSSGSTTSGTTGAGGATSSTTTGSGGSSTTTTGSSGGGGSGAGAPHGCQEFSLSGDPDHVVDATVAPASAGGIAWDGSHYEAVYTGTAPVGFNVYLSLLNPSGALLTPPGQQSLSLLGSDAVGGPVVMAIDRQGVLWSDRRTGDYEIFFAALKGNGQKVGDDLRLSSAKGFSVNPALAFTGQEFLALWQDDRSMNMRLFGQRVSLEGALIGGNVEITQPPADTADESPALAVGPTNVGVVHVSKGPSTSAIVVRILAPDLTPTAIPAITVEDAMGAPASPVVVWNFDRYVIAWHDLATPSKAIRAMAVGPDGSTLVPPTEVTAPGANHSRAPRLLPLGDSLLLVYADDRDQNAGYELYARTLGPTLAPLSAELRVTNAMGDSLDPQIALGPGGALGEVGIAFKDDRAAGKPNIFFTRLVCKSPGP